MWRSIVSVAIFFLLISVIFQTSTLANQNSGEKNRSLDSSSVASSSKVLLNQFVDLSKNAHTKKDQWIGAYEEIQELKSTIKVPNVLSVFGATFVGIYWHLDTYNAHGGAGNSWWCGDNPVEGWAAPPGYGNNWLQHLSHDFDLTSATGTVTLTFDHMYDCETGYDGGYVSVSTDGGGTYTLIDPVGGYAGTINDWQFSNTHIPAFTGTSGGGGYGSPTWVSATFDLTAYAGQNIKLLFAFMSDAGWSDEDGLIDTDGGWYIDNLSIDDDSGNLFFDDMESGQGAWNPAMGNDGGISGVVYESDGVTPIENALVSFYYTNTGYYITDISTAADGTYERLGLVPGDYRVKAAAGGFFEEYYSEKTDYQSADDVTVASTTPNINFTLDQAGTISGNVTNTVGDPLENIEIQVWDYDSDEHWGSAWTDADGNYIFAPHNGLPASDYRVQASGGGYFAEYYNNASNRDAADRVSVTPPNDTPNINFQLSDVPPPTLITVDGVKDAFWDTATGQLNIGPGNLISGENDSDNDCSGTLYLAYDGDYLYGYFEALDDVVSGQHPNVTYYNDGFSLELDLDPSSIVPVPFRSRYHEPNRKDIAQIAFTAKDDQGAVASGTTNTTVARQETASGYKIEFAVPLQEILNEQASPVETLEPTVGLQIGFAVELDDQDSGLSREGQMVWGHHTANPQYFYRNVTHLGHMTFNASNQVAVSQDNLVLPPVLPHLQVASITSYHWVDGDFNEWWGIEAWVFANDNQGLANIDSVWIDGPDGSHYRLYDDGTHNDDQPDDGKFVLWFDNLNAPPAVGTYTFKGSDDSKGIGSTTDDITAVLDSPGNVTPVQNSFVSDPNFLISWDAVSGATWYHVQVTDVNWDHTFWQSENITDTSINYNEDGRGEPLTEGTPYFLTVRCGDDRNNAERNSVRFVYSTSDAPVFTEPVRCSSNHDGNDFGEENYRFYLRARVNDPQGLGDIASVTATDPLSVSYALYDDATHGDDVAGDGYYQREVSNLLNPPTTGIYEFVVEDLSANTETGIDSLLILDYPRNAVPGRNGVLPSDAPIFHWDSVENVMDYNINVVDEYWNDMWDMGGITDTFVVYNSDGNGTPLVEGQRYQWGVGASNHDLEIYSWHWHEWFTYLPSPIIESASAQPALLNPGENVTISATVWDYDGLNSVVAEISGEEVKFNYSLTLYDDGAHSDGAAGDSVFANTWATDGTPMSYLVDIVATDNNSNTQTAEHATYFSTDADVLPIQVTYSDDSEEWPTLFQHADGSLTLAYRYQGDVLRKKSYDLGVTWSDSMIVASGYSPTLTQTSLGTLWMLWEDADVIKYSTSADDITWSPEADFVNGPGRNWYPDIYSDPTGKMIVVWSSDRGGNWDIFYRTSLDNGTSWSADQQLTTDGSNDQDPAVVIDQTGMVHVVWYSDRSGQNHIWYSSSVDFGTTWSPPSQITHGTRDEYRPNLTEDAVGGLWLVWYLYPDHGSDVYYMTQPFGGVWSAAFQFTRFMGQDRRPDVANVGGQPWVVWTSDRTGNWEIWRGVLGVTQDLTPPPYSDWLDHRPHAPDSNDNINVFANALDPTGVSSVKLHYSINGSWQTPIDLIDDGAHGDFGAGDDVYGTVLGPYPKDTYVEYYAVIWNTNSDSFRTWTNGFNVIEPFEKKANILLVDGSEADWYGWMYDDDGPKFYHDELRALGIHYDFWNSWDRGPIDEATILQYTDGVVIFFDPSWNTMTSSEEDALKAYLDAGGGLFITGRSISEVNQSSTLLLDYLGVQYREPDVGHSRVLGETGDPISDQLDLNLADGDGDNQSNYDRIEANAPAEIIYTYDDQSLLSCLGGRVSYRQNEKPAAGDNKSEKKTPAPTEHSSALAKMASNLVAGVRIEKNNYKGVFLGFGFESIDNATDRTTLLRRILDYLARPQSVSYNFSGQGWYLVSLSVTPSDLSLSNVFPGALSAYHWENDTYVQYDVLETEKAFWLAIPNGISTINVEGLPLHSYTSHYVRGWSMIGAVYDSTNFQNPEDTPDGSVLITYGWDATAKVYELADRLDPKQGYWNAVVQECDLTVAGGGGYGGMAKTSKPELPSEFVEQFGSMPPPPPEIDWKTGKLFEAPTTYALEQNFPNPFNPSTTIKYQLPEDVNVQLVIYNVLGQKVRTLVNQKQKIGYYNVLWDGNNDAGKPVSSGLYIYAIKAGDFMKVRKMVTMK